MDALSFQVGVGQAFQVYMEEVSVQTRYQYFLEFVLFLCNCNTSLLLPTTWSSDNRWWSCSNNCLITTPVKSVLRKRQKTSSQTQSEICILLALFRHAWLVWNSVGAWGLRTSIARFVKPASCLHYFVDGKNCLPLPRSLALPQLQSPLLRLRHVPVPHQGDSHTNKSVTSNQLRFVIRSKFRSIRQRVQPSIGYALADWDSE